MYGNFEIFCAGSAAQNVKKWPKMEFLNLLRGATGQKIKIAICEEYQTNLCENPFAQRRVRSVRAHGSYGICAKRAKRSFRTFRTH